MDHRCCTSVNHHILWCWDWRCYITAWFVFVKWLTVDIVDIIVERWYQTLLSTIIPKCKSLIPEAMNDHFPRIHLHTCTLAQAKLYSVCYSCSCDPLVECPERAQICFGTIPITSLLPHDCVYLLMHDTGCSMTTTSRLSRLESSHNRLSWQSCELKIGRLVCMHACLHT